MKTNIAKVVSQADCGLDLSWGQPVPKLVNLTTKEIVLYGGDGVVVVPPSGQLATVSCERQQIGDVLGCPIYRDVFSGLDTLPEAKERTVYLVSSFTLVAMRAMGVQRADVLSPGTGNHDNVIRDESGRVSGAASLKAV